MFYLAAFESVLAIRDIALNMSACGSKRKESRPSPSLSLSPPSLGPLLLSRSLLPLTPLSFSLALSCSLAAREWERCALRCAGERKRERERRASLREIGGEVRFAAERGASLRERETEKAALRRAPCLLPFPSPSILTPCSPELQRCFNPSRAQSNSWARSGMRISRAFLCVCLCFACVPADLR